LAAFVRPTPPFVPAPRPRLLGVASPRPRPPFIRARERVSDFSGPWRSPNLSQRCCGTSAWLFDFCNRLSCDARALFPWARSSRDEGGCPSCVATPGCAFAPATFPLCGGQAAPCAAASHVHLSDARPCDRTLSAEHGDPRPRTLLAWRKRHERDVGRRTSRLGRSTLMDCRPSVHRAGLASARSSSISYRASPVTDGGSGPGWIPFALTLPAEAAVVSPPREGRRRTSTEMLSTTWNRLTEGIAPCCRVGRDSGVRHPRGTLHDEALTLF